MNKIRSAVLEKVCGITSTLPENSRYEVAFAGKSNVGKSSLINALLMRKSLARTSSQPGKTQTINYYRINENETREDFAPDCYLVDLPGYGYANASVKVKEAWGKMIERYLNRSANLRAVILLVDIRHAPSANDVQMYEWIRKSGMQCIIVATKKDKIKKSQTEKNVNLIKSTLKPDASAKFMTFSSETGEGRDELWELIRQAGE